MTYLDPKQGTAEAFKRMHGETVHPRELPHPEMVGQGATEYPTCDNCRAKMQKAGASWKCPSCGLSRAILPGEILGL